MVKTMKSWPFAIAIFLAVIFNVLASAGGSYIGPDSWWFTRLMAPIPYKDVHLVEQRQDGRTLTFTATFIKERCEFQGLVVIGHFIGETDFLRWHDVDGLPPNYDRIKGLQTLRLEVFMKRDGYDKIEVRTRHICSDRQGSTASEEIANDRGVIVDKVFATLIPGEVITPEHPKPARENYVGPEGGYRK